MEILPERPSKSRLHDNNTARDVTSPLTKGPSSAVASHDLDQNNKRTRDNATAVPAPVKGSGGGDTFESKNRDSGFEDYAGDRHAIATANEVEPDSATMRRSRIMVGNAPLAGDGREEHSEEARVRPALLSRRSQTTTQPPVNKSKSPTEASHPTPPPHPAATFSMPERVPKSSFEGADGEAHPKEKKKGVSFLSRFIGANKNKKGTVSEDEGENENEETESRPEGMEAQFFAHNAHDVEGIEFHPKYPQPPAYIKFRAKFKKEREFDRVFLAQELQAGRMRPPRRRTTASMNSPALQGTPLQSDENAIWALEFSKDGKYLAAGGQDKVVRVWAVLSTPEERQLHEREEDEEATASRHFRLDAPVFQKLAIREYEGHEGPVIDLSWSKNNFLLSASADKTVRLWHTSRAECLCTFKHTEHVHSVQFHPRDDRFFLAGSRDMKLRFWSIPDKSVAFWQQLHEVITAVAFTPDGKTAIAGTINGVCNFYETEGLKYQTQTHVRSAYGKNAKGSKICSIQTINLSDRDKGDVKMLVSSNDARIRLYNFRDKSLEIKFKGHKSEERTIKAQISDDGEYVVCGSEDKGAYIWSTGPSESEKPTQRPVEFFEATTSQTTCSVLAPINTRQLLSQSEDPIYDLCNPPPVTLLSRSESAASSHAPSGANSTSGTPRTIDSPHKKAMETPAYLARSGHPGGQLIVTASNTGVIRVYRQDCAFSKRKSNEDSASLFGGKRPSSLYMARAMSKTSSAAGGRGGRSDSIGTQPPQDRILSWRQGVSSTQSFDRNGRQNSDAKSTRSISPSKGSFSFRRSGSIRRTEPSSLTPLTPAMRIERAVGSVKRNNSASATNSSPPNASKTGASATPSIQENGPKNEKEDLASPDTNPLWLANGQSFMGWNKNEYASQALPPPSTKDDGLLHAPDTTRPGLSPNGSRQSIVSALSSDEVSDEAAEMEATARDDELKCKKCNGTGFKAGLVKGKGHRLVCQRCGTVTAD